MKKNFPLWEEFRANVLKTTTATPENLISLQLLEYGKIVGTVRTLTIIIIIMIIIIIIIIIIILIIVLIILIILQKGIIAM